MDLYRYKAIDQAGRIHNGKVDAINIADLEARLGKIGYDLIKYKRLGDSKSGFTGSGVSRRDLITFCFHLEQTYRAGVPILESLHDIRDSTENPRLREVIVAMIESIEGGKTLSQAMRDFPRVFNNVFANLVKAGEQSGEIAEVFYHLNENLKWQDEQATLTRKLLMYPLFVGIVVIAVVFFLMIYLVPELLKFISTMGQEIPFHTTLLITISNSFVNFWYIYIILPVLIYISIIIGVKVSSSFHYQIDMIKLKFPVIGPILNKLILTRLSSFFAIMYASGITIIDCIKTGEEIAGNRVIESAMREVGQKVSDGATLSDSFESTRLFPPLVLRMIRVGETTGALEMALKNVSYFYSRDVKESIDRLQSMIEPGMTIFLGIIIAWVMFSILGPIYDLITNIRF